MFVEVLGYHHRLAHREAQLAGWLFWAINNNGVEKFSNEPERYDLSKTAHVKAVFAPSAGGNTIEFDLKPGEWKLVESAADR